MIRLTNPSLLLVGFIFLALFLTRKTAYVGYSQLRLLEAEGGSRVWAYTPQVLLTITTAFLILGLARPQWQKIVQHERFLARDIVLVMDLSHSMENPMGGSWYVGNGPRKIDVAKKAALQFVQKRENDRIGLLVFGDETFGSWPLTRDLGVISKKVARLGSTFYGGTNLAQPLVTAMEHFREMGQSASRILVFLSDGEAAISGKDKEMIIREMKKMGIHFYLLGLSLRKENSDLLEIVNRAEGRFIAVESGKDLTVAFEEIDRLEASRVEIEIQGKSHELYPIFVVVGLGFLFILTLLRNTFFIELC
jgi:Ca-activated chloride channel family protein